MRSADVGNGEPNLNRSLLLYPESDLYLHSVATEFSFDRLTVSTPGLRCPAAKDAGRME